VRYVSNLVEPDQVLCTDIPWATAWYGNRRSVLLPRTTADLLEIHGKRVPVGALYLTTETGDKPYTTGLAAGPERAWLPILNGKIPADFPWRHAVAIPPGSRDQIFLTDRDRWGAGGSE
jgi:hypothetical protein